jgi:hypothetical protein
MSEYCNQAKCLPNYILLHVWGFLAEVTWALSRNNAVVHCYLSLATQQYWALLASLSSNNVISSIVTHTTIDTETLLWYSEFYWHHQYVWKSLKSRRACVFGYGLLLVGRLSLYREIARGAHEFIPWTVETVDRRVYCRLVMDYTLRCCCGVQVDR